MDKRLVLVTFRLLVGSLTLLAIVLQATYLQQLGVLNLFNYLGYFTNLSNILAAIIFIISALYVVKSRAPSLTDTLIRGAATLYMIITGLVYITLLINEDLGLLMPWVNAVTHIIMPLAVITDWFVRPPQVRLKNKYILIWLAFPLLYLAYTLTRGAILNWYPYTFLNPAEVGGYGGVLVYCAAILVAFAVVGWLLTLGTKLRRQPAD